jgi:NADPH-dependent glutamate synthase beta subunit-like oxidoreductase/Pyruvate/2-oxoacid:ferredoxin oxidoreductase delta subunit
MRQRRTINYQDPLPQTTNLRTGEGWLNMGLLKKGKKKPLRTTGRGAAGAKTSTKRPRQITKLAPCVGHCPSGNDIRGWLNIISQREKSGLSFEEAMDAAWFLETETTPFPAIMGRVCPHPCESECNRKAKDTAVAINSVERSIGDWGLERGLQLRRIEGSGPFEERVAVIGAGPAGLSLAYQMARRGYPVTVFESLPKPGGMLRYGIPDYRLPRAIIDAEVSRITDLGVEIRCGVCVGEGDTTLDALRADFDAVFVAIGAHKGKKLGVPGEDGPGVYTGTEFLRRTSQGDPPQVGGRIVIIGGGDTAIDAARVALRSTLEAHTAIDAARVARRAEMGTNEAQPHVTILYRRTRAEMPAIDREIEEALEEDIDIRFLAAPAKILRNGSGEVAGMLVQKMRLGDEDASGRRRPIPIEGDLEEIAVETVITAVSQAPDCETLGAFRETGWPSADDWGVTDLERVWSGGDNLNLGLATTAIGQGRKAAISMHAQLRGIEAIKDLHGPPIGPERIKLDYYPDAPQASRLILSAEERLADPRAEIDSGIALTAVPTEAARCFSCGECFGCERCWMYCTPGCFRKVKDGSRPGHYYTIDLSACDGCNKCQDECPCGYLDMA